MTCVSATLVRNDGDARVMDVLLISDDVPDELPTTGKDILGLMATDKFAPFSVLFVVNASAASKVYIANEAGQFIAQ